jgi:hypothetical protein
MSRDASRQKPAGFTTGSDDSDLRGATLSLRRAHELATGEIEVRAGGSLQQLRVADANHPRTLGFASLGAEGMRRGEARFAAGSVALQGTRGASGDALRSSISFARAIASASLAVGSTSRSSSSAVRVDGSYGIVSDGAGFERFTVGGSAPSFIDTTTVDQWIPMPVLPFGALRGRRYASYRVSLRGDALYPYLWAGTAGDSLTHWMRVMGIDGSIAAPPLPFFRLPASMVTAGVGYSIDEPWRKKTRAYVSLRYRP